ncbi:MAG TPA: hypothetical protein EYG60_05220 [Campylobacterales bacterium]|nr:hypothetical protein [Campylobacterales bacterium]
MFYYLFFPIVLFGFSKIYLLPDEVDFLVTDINRDIRKSSRVEIATHKFHHKSIYKTLRRENNRGKKIFCIVDTKNRDSIRDLAVLKNVDIRTIEGLNHTSSKTNFVICDSSIYLLPFELNSWTMDRVYGVAIRLDREEEILQLQKRWGTIWDRANPLFEEER